MFLIEKVKQYRKVPKESENFSSLLFTHPQSWCCFPNLTVFFYVKKVHIYQHTVPHMIRFKLTSKPGRLAPHSLNVCSFTQVFVRYLPWAGHCASEGAWPCPDLRHQVQINSTCKNSYCLLRLFFSPQPLTFLFCVGVELMNNIVVVSGEQRRDSAIHTHVSILPQTPVLSRLPHNIEQSSTCYMVGPYWLSILI